MLFSQALEFLLKSATLFYSFNIYTKLPEFSFLVLLYPFKPPSDSFSSSVLIDLLILKADCFDFDLDLLRLVTLDLDLLDFFDFLLIVLLSLFFEDKVTVLATRSL